MTQGEWIRIATWRGAIKLELAGMRHSSGRSAARHAHRALNLKCKVSDKQAILAEIQAIMDRGPLEPWPGR